MTILIVYSMCLRRIGYLIVVLLNNEELQMIREFDEKWQRMNRPFYDNIN